jgi:hypothetical protein
MKLIIELFKLFAARVGEILSCVGLAFDSVFRVTVYKQAIISEAW